MAISKIVKVGNLYACVRYCTRDSKTESGYYVSTYGCNMPFVVRDFEEVTETRRLYKSRDFSVNSWMIFQSFAYGETTPEQAHEIGMKLAKSYLGEGHQFMVTTHIDAGHIHNHIVFNATNFQNYQSFDSKNKHIITDLRIENDSLCREYGLSVIENPKGKGISQREFYARKNNHSYKARLESLIDASIKNSDTWRDFLEIMDRNIEVRFSNPIAFKFPEQEHFTRASRLGLDYSESSIKYRIEHKEFEVVKQRGGIKSLINTGDARFQGRENAGLKKWATLENINTLAETAHKLHVEQTTRAGLSEARSSAIARLNETGKKIESLDKQISEYGEFINQSRIYKSSYALMTAFKVSEEKDKFKRAHYKEFKAYDYAKSFLNKFKGGDGKLPNPEDVKEELELLKTERSVRYTEYQNLKAGLNSVSQNKDGVNQKDIQKNHDMETSR
jgi:hypothetical protein